MTHTHKELYTKISNLSVEKLSVAMAFIRFLEQQKETELLIEKFEKNEIIEDGDKKARLAWLERLHNAAIEAADEETPVFSRMQFNRELIDFSDEE